MPGGGMMLYISAHDVTTAVDVPAEATVGGLRARIAAMDELATVCDPSACRIMMHGRVLADDGAALADSGVSAEATLHIRGRAAWCSPRCAAPHPHCVFLRLSDDGFSARCTGLGAVATGMAPVDDFAWRVTGDHAACGRVYVGMAANVVQQSVSRAVMGQSSDFAGGGWGLLTRFSDGLQCDLRLRRVYATVAEAAYRSDDVMSWGIEGGDAVLRKNGGEVHRWAGPPPGVAVVPIAIWEQGGVGTTVHLL